MSIGAPKSAGLVADDGFTLVELLVTMFIATVVLFAVLQSADIFRRTTEAQSKTVDTQEQGRAALRTIVQDLREARPVTGASTPLVPTPPAATAAADDLVIAAFVPTASGRVAGWRRYCVSPSPGTTLYAGQRAADAYAAPGICGVPSNGWTYTPLVIDRLRDGTKLFSFSADADFVTHGCAVASATPCLPPAAAIRGVGVRLSIADTPSASAARVTTGAVSFRNRNPQ